MHLPHSSKDKASAVARSGSCIRRGEAVSCRSPARCGRTCLQPNHITTNAMVLLMIAAVAVISLGYFAVDKFVLSKRDAGAKQASAQPAQVTPVQIPESRSPCCRLWT